MVLKTGIPVFLFYEKLIEFSIIDLKKLEVERSYNG